MTQRVLAEATVAAKILRIFTGKIIPGGSETVIESPEKVIIETVIAAAGVT